MTDLNALVLSSAASAVTDIPAVVLNRARMAAVVSKGYETLDLYRKWQGYLFAAGVLGAVSASLALAKRHAKSAETYPLYIGAGIASAALAWVTRPDSLRATPPPADPSHPATTARSLAWMDAQVAARTQQHPGWEASTWARLANDLGQSTLSPSLQVIITRNTK